jgi:hypothetical protein
VCEGTVLPHCAHLLSCGACHRLAALRVRNRIFEVLRLGTPIITERERKHGLAERQRWNVERLKREDLTDRPLHRFDPSTFLDLQLIQRAPIRFRSAGVAGSLKLGRFANARSIAIAMRIGRQI